MVNTNYSVASLLSSIYNTNASSLSDSLERIASGKRIVNPSDDFGGYLTAEGFQTDINNYTTVKQGIQAGKSLADYAKGVGNQILADLSHLQDLYEQNAATTDTNKTAAYAADFSATVSRIDDAIANSYYDGIQVYQAANLKDVAVNAENSSLVVAITPTAAATDSANWAITDAANLATAITDAQTYLAELSSWSTELDNASKLADTAVSSKQAAISAITDINEVMEMSALTNLQVRGQAAVAMMTQSNIAQAQLARLFS